MWRYKKKPVRSVEDMPEGAIGFIYRIVNNNNGKDYIGKKSLYSITNPEVSKGRYESLKQEGIPVRKTKDKVKSRAAKKVIWRYKMKDVKKETNWFTYTGSSKELNADIKKGDKVSREILSFCFSKKELTYREVKEQFLRNVLERCDSYNLNVLSKFFSQVDCD